MVAWRVFATALALFLAACVQACGSRGQHLVGAPERVSPDDPEVQKALHFAVTEYNKASNDMFASKVMRILSAKQQIVSGIKYILEVELGRTQCKQGKFHDLETCDFSATPHNVKDQQQIAQNIEERPLEMKVDASNTEFQSIVALAIQEFNKKSSFIYKIVQYLKADVKVVEGNVYIFDIVLGKTDCPVVKSMKPETNCQIIQTDGQAEFYLCHFIVWKAPDSEKKQMLSSNCKKLDL